MVATGFGGTSELDQALGFELFEPAFDGARGKFERYRYFTSTLARVSLNVGE